MTCRMRPLLKKLLVPPYKTRNISTTPANNDAWLSKLLVRKIEPTKEAHSRMLSDKEIIFALQTHNFRPDSKKEYLENFKKTVQLIDAQDKFAQHVKLVGSWTTEVGDQDQAIHIWQYKGGFSTLDESEAVLNANPDHIKLKEEQSKLVRSRHLQYVFAFSYWPAIESREPNNIYEMRSYTLKPGTMIEWGNSWARAISFRQNNQEAFAGFFSQIGRLYNVHHIFCYKNYNARRETRESAWRSPGWDECVAYTVPLIREMHCRILRPTDISPTQ